MHPLQEKFASAEGEADWCDTLQRLVEAGDLAAAQTILDAALAPLEREELAGDMARLCRAAGPGQVAISGWAELGETIAAYAGGRISGLTLAIGNDADLAFEKGTMHRPFMLLGLYTDEAWDWSRATRDEVLGQCADPQGPGWAGAEEDLEAWLDITGLDALNSALVHAKQRHFIRDCEGGDEAAPAPLRYVEFVIGCWWRALAFHRAVADALAAQPLPGEPVVVSGLVDMRPEVPCAHMPKGRGGKRRPSLKKVAALAEEAGESAFDAPDMAAKGLIVRGAAVEEKPLTGTDLRRRFAANDAVEEPKKGLLARLFGR